MDPGDESTWPPIRIALWLILFVVCAALFGVVPFGPDPVRAARPQPGQLTDFIQEWLSAKNYFAGDPVYAPQTEALFKHTGMRPADSKAMLPYNAHPPAAVLLALPFGKLDYPDALAAWNGVTFALFLAAVAVLLVELRVPLHPACLLPLGVLLLVCAPVFAQVFYGQLNFLLAALLVFGWAADRRGFVTLGGVFLGVAAAAKLFPAFLVVYFVFTRRWRGVLGMAIGFGVLNGAALGLFGTDAFRTYVTDVIPSLDAFRSGWRNLSLAGFFTRIFDPDPVQTGGAVVGNPQLAKIMTLVSSAAVLAVVVWECVRGKDLFSRDRAWAVATVGMLLVSPATWSHYFLLLLVPMGVVWMRLSGPLRVPMWVCFVLLMIPHSLPVKPLVAGKTPEEAMRFLGPHHIPLTTAQNLGLVSLQTYALLALFVLTLAVPVRQGEEKGS